MRAGWARAGAASQTDGGRLPRQVDSARRRHPARHVRRDAESDREFRLHRDGTEVDGVKLRYRSQAVPCRVAGPAPAGAHAQLALELAEPVDGAAPGQTACLLAGDVVVGWATITRA